jgi:hypothetical protein
LFFTHTQRLKLLGFDKPQSAAHSGANEQAFARDVRDFSKVVAWLLHGEPQLQHQAPNVQAQPRLPERIAAVIERGLSEDTAQHWKSANTMRTALQLACQTDLGRPVDRALRPMAAKHAPRKGSRNLWFTASGALVVALVASRGLGPVPQPAAEPESDVSAASLQPASPEAQAVEEQPMPSEPARPVTYVGEPASPASPIDVPAAARVVPRKPPIPELRVPAQRRLGLATNIAPAHAVCLQLREVKRSRSLSDAEAELWLAQCTKR